MVKRLLLMMLFLCAVAQGQTGEAADAEAKLATGEIGTLLQQDELKTYEQLRAYTNADLAATEFDDFPLPGDIFEFSYRSPGRAFFYSLLVPGSGQIYTGSKTKAAVFLGVEAVLWLGYFSFHGDGRDKEDEYVNYADANWSAEAYTNWLIEEKNIVDDDSVWYDVNGQPQTFAHHLPDVKSQQYYEMIGKYEQFRYGWTDTDYWVGKDVSQFREMYLVMRDDSNDAFGKAKAAAILSIANHLVSAFEGALSAKRFNRKQDTFTRFEVEARMATLFNERVPQLTLKYKFF